MALAHWIVEGEPPMDLSDVDIRRFEPFQANEQFLRDRTVETLGLLYAPHWPHYQYETARNVRRSPLHDRMEAEGACFGSLNGWERPMFFARPELGVEATYEYSWGRQNWHKANAEEHRCVRERVGLFDLTSFAKFLVQGPGAAEVLDRLSAGAVAGPVGGSVYTQWLNDNGGIEADLTVSRLSTEEFLVIGGAGTRTRDHHTIKTAIAAAGTAAFATVTDVTSAYAVIAVMGPQSRQLLQPLTEADLSDEAFPFATNRWIDVGSAQVLANRMSYVGELGWELYVPAEFAVSVFDQIRSAGKSFDMALCGYHTLNSLRFEKGYRHWGHEVTPDESPVEAGLSFAVAWDKSADFRGRAAVEAQRTSGVSKRLVQVAVDDPSVILHHNETIWRDRKRVGYITDGMWGHTVNAAVGMGWVESDSTITGDWVKAGDWEIELPGRQVPARVQFRPFL